MFEKSFVINLLQASDYFRKKKRFGVDEVQANGKSKKRSEITKTNRLQNKQNAEKSNLRNEK